MNEEAKKLVAACELVYGDPKSEAAYKEYKTYQESHYKDPTVYRQDYEWNKGPNFEEAYRAYRDLAETKATLNKYRTQLNKIENFNNMEKYQLSGISYKSGENKHMNILLKILSYMQNLDLNINKNGKIINKLMITKKS